MSEQGRRYCAFISYSQKDRAVAARLQRAMEAFRAPRGVVADGIDATTRKIGRFFRDEEDLGAAPDLTEELQRQITNADALIVVCSPHAAQSVWVNREIIHFKRTGRADRIFAVIVDGEPNAGSSADPVRSKRECFPPALKVRVASDGALTNEREEPLGIDLRKDGLAKVRARLAAGLLGVDFDDLWRRDRRRAKAQVVLWSAVSASVLAAAAVTTVVLVNRTEQEGNFARFADRAAAVGRDAIAEMRRVAAIADYARVREDKTVVAAQMQAATLAYALALSGDPARATPLLEQLGYVNVLDLPGAGTAQPEPGWGYAISTGYGIKPELIDLRSGARTPLGAKDNTTPGFSPDYRWAYVGSGESELTVWNVATGSKAWSYKSDSISLDLPSVAFDHAGKLAAVASRGKLRLVELETGRELGVIPFDNYRAPETNYDQNDLASGLSFSLDDTRLLVMQGISGARVYDLTARTWLPQPDAMKAAVSAPLAGFDKSHVLIPETRADGSLFYPRFVPVNVETGIASEAIEPTGCTAGSYGLDCHEFGAQLSRDHRWMVWGATFGVVANLRIFDLAGQTPPVSPKVSQCEQDTAAPGKCTANSYAISPKKLEVAVGTGGSGLLIVDMATGEVLRELDRVEGSIHSVRYSDDGNRLVALVTPQDFRGATQIVLWDAERGRVLSRSGIVLSGERLYDIKASGSELLLTSDKNNTTLWSSLAPANETMAGALKRVCAWRKEEGLKLSDEDLALLPRQAGRSNDVCAWKVE